MGAGEGGKTTDRARAPEAVTWAESWQGVWCWEGMLAWRRHIQRWTDGSPMVLQREHEERGDISVPLSKVRKCWENCESSRTVSDRRPERWAPFLWPPARQDELEAPINTLDRYKSSWNQRVPEGNGRIPNLPESSSPHSDGIGAWNETKMDVGKRIVFFVNTDSWLLHLQLLSQMMFSEVGYLSKATQPEISEA